MKIEEAKHLKKQFRRLFDVKHKTFYRMITILKAAQKEKHKKGGRKHKLSLENMLLVSLFTSENIYRTHAKRMKETAL
jgi:hypothetical protein